MTHLDKLIQFFQACQNEGLTFEQALRLARVAIAFATVDTAAGADDECNPLPTTEEANEILRTRLTTAPIAEADDE